MRYAYKDLGEQPAGSTAIVRWTGGAANVILLDGVNFSKYQYSDGRPFFYGAGGRYPRPPARLAIPEDGHWYIVVDRGSYAGGPPTVEVLAAQGEQPQDGHRHEELASAERTG
jgi:hypothetical protein